MCTARDFDGIIDDLSDRDERKRIKKIADDLGAVRDHDVALTAFERLATKAEVAEIKNGIDKLIEALLRILVIDADATFDRDGE